MLKNKQFPRIVMSVGILILYGLNPDNQFNQTLASLAAFYWLGSSAGSFNKDERRAAN